VAAEARAASRGLHPVRPESGPWHALAEVAEAEGAAAIVVGRRGAGAVRRALLGSVVTALLRHARRPVLVVPPR
jgi:nucleotide-binding universal stress UspA family protein